VIGRACTPAFTSFLVAGDVSARRFAEPVNTIQDAKSCAPSANRQRHLQGRQLKMSLKIPLATLTIAVMFAPAAHADPSPQNSGQNPVARTVFNQPSNIPGKSLEAVAVSYPPGAKSGPHHHAKSAFIMAYVISGAIRSQVGGEPARVYYAGETWREAPGAHHTVSENASATEPAELLAVFLVDTGDGPLTTDDTAENESPR
jgi:quercetin dioxygenase-like cupin family protein